MKIAKNIEIVYSKCQTLKKLLLLDAKFFSTKSIGKLHTELLIIFPFHND
jgi:hypothetical protein